jgi:hypothetical protein
MALARSVALASLLSAASAGWQPGTGVLLTVPALGSAGPVHGVAYGLPGRADGYKALVLNNGMCNVWWDKGHNTAENKRADGNLAAVPLREDGSFVLPGDYWAAPTDLTSPRYAAFIVSADFPDKWPAYILEKRVRPLRPPCPRRRADF